MSTPSADPAATELSRLLSIMERLRAPGGCPWDAEQTPESLKPYIIEEAYEVIEAIDRGNVAELREELGDLLLQVVFQSRIHEERGIFAMVDVIRAIADKLVRRHPHVFAGMPTGDATMLASQWEAIKRAEKPENPGEHPLEHLPRQLPALQKAGKLAKKTGFNEAAGGCAGFLEQAEGEMQALGRSLARDDRAFARKHLGSLLFTLAGLAAAIDDDAEDILRDHNRLVLSRHIEKLENRNFPELPETQKNKKP